MPVPTVLVVLVLAPSAEPSKRENSAPDVETQIACILAIARNVTAPDSPAVHLFAGHDAVLENGCSALIGIAIASSTKRGFISVIGVSLE